MCNYLLNVIRLKRLCEISHHLLKCSSFCHNSLFSTYLISPKTLLFKEQRELKDVLNISLRKFSEKPRPIHERSETTDSQEEFVPNSKVELVNGYEKNQKTTSSLTGTNKEINEVTDVDQDDEEYGSVLLNYYAEKAKEDLDYMDDVDYHDIQDVNQRMFYKIIDVWLREVGSTKRGHRDFINALLNSLDKFNVKHDINAYVRLLDCFPHGKHTGIHRGHWFKAAFQDKLSEHALGVKLFCRLPAVAVPNDKLFNKATDLFGRFSPATWTARSAMFWQRKLIAADPHPITKLELATMSPVEIAFYGLRQMNPGIKCHYHTFKVDKSRCEETLKAHEIDSVISCQTDEQISLLADHDVATPVFIEGPYLAYFKTKSVRYYVMRSDPKKAEMKKKSGRTSLLTTKEWWMEFYDADWKTGKKSVTKIEENFFPIVDIPDVQPDKLHEIALVDKDTSTVEGPIYAIACTDYKSPEALMAWIRGLLPQNPVLSQCSVVMREDDAFLLNAPKTDPNESFYETVELPEP